MSEIDDIFANHKQTKSSKKRAAPQETVVEGSRKKPKVDSKKPKPEIKKTKPPLSTKPPPEKKDDIQKFKDSRGTGPRKKTEEGWSVYKEDELGISNEGGDTPLCPFDCECCF